ncbi:MAG: hypothetical protein MJ118_02945, partial [Clostridia bacterium]|nr:hypothetical protein [Clostridia bacterium]
GVPIQKSGKVSYDDGKTQFELRGDPDIEAENIKNGTAAIDKLIEDAKTAKNADQLVVEDAMYRSDIGYIDFKWGVPGIGDKFKREYGLSHIIEKRNAENGSGEETVYKLVDVIAKSVNGELQGNGQVKQGLERLRLSYDGYTAILVKEDAGNHWLLTGWENEKEANAYAVGEVNDSSNATAVSPTRTRTDGVDAFASTSMISPSSDESQEPHQLRDSVSENGLEDLRKERSDLEERIDMAYFNDVSDAEIRKMENRLVKVNHEIDKIAEKEKVDKGTVFFLPISGLLCYNTRQ